MGFIGKLFGKGQKDSQASFYASLYPETVRYALSHKGAKMGKAEIRALVDRFTYEAMYLVVKVLAKDREDQRRFLADLTVLFLDPEYHEGKLRDLLLGYIDQMPDDAEAAGAKLAQLNRSGSSRWQDAFRQLAENTFAENPTGLPCLIAHTTLLGYQHFVQVYGQKRNAKLMILVPDWMIDPDEELMGYEVSLGDKPGVTLQPKDECLIGSWACMKSECRFHHRFCGSAVFIDDTINTGATSDKLHSFWKSEYGLNIPVERIRVITDLRA